MPRSRYIRSSYLMSKSLADNGRFSWACNIKMLFCQLGFGNVWTEQGVGHEDSFILVFSQIVSDVSTQNWHSEISNSSKLRTYCQFKNVLEEEKYLTNLDIFKFRKALTNFKISCQSLRGMAIFPYTNVFVIFVFKIIDC